MASQTLRVGIVGAGANTKLRHIPGMRAIEGVEIVGVVNRTVESTARVAEEYAIPHRFAHWSELVASPDIDAVVIGTWPNLHCEVTCAALNAGKHVLCEARMARNFAEAKQMLEVARANKDLVAQIVPSPFGLECGPTVEAMIKEHYLGDLREMVVIGATDQFWDYNLPLHWRQDEEISGRNVLALGILHETLMRWAPEPVQVFAQAETFEPTRPAPEGEGYREVTIPDSVQILAELKGGVRAIYHLSGSILFGPGLQIHLYGSRGTIKVTFANGTETVHCGRAGDKELQLLEIPEDERGKWQVEEEFVRAIRGNKKVRLNDFKTALAGMEFTEAVGLSIEEEAAISLPLDE
ncbi:MAG: Gfo/Idh/MocA family oxidoreductase [Planctomycetaceae bacterium]|nr:Gfo/Idh/MocA family oxidoreductase [Planctomycetaceae bacterium]MCB9953952.1 Gfo/Idh/MocA family oxidoreductase [Planctomycetaceae bacterium]